MQFIPVVELAASGAAAAGVDADGTQTPQVAAWSVGAEQYGRFCVPCSRNGCGATSAASFVQSFEVALGAWMGQASSLCLFRPTCGLHCGRAQRRRLRLRSLRRPSASSGQPDADAPARPRQRRGTDALRPCEGAPCRAPARRAAYASPVTAAARRSASCPRATARLSRTTCVLPIRRSSGTRIPTCDSWRTS